MKKINVILAIGVLIGSFSCRKEYDSPPVQTLPVGNVLTVTELKAFRDSVGKGYTFTEDYSVYATATTDETSGNFYKEIYVQAGGEAIQLRLVNSGGIYEGDSVRIYLKGTTVDIYNGMYQLDAVDVDNNIIKQATDKSVAPTLRTIATIDPVADRGLLIQLENVEFEGISVGSTWADAVTQSDVNHNLVDCFSNSIIVRSSGYSTFAEEVIPELSGSFIGIVGIYTSSTDTNSWTLADLQIYVREPSEADFTNARCTSVPYLAKNFDDGSITSNGWTIFDVTNTNSIASWTTSNQGSTSDYGMIKNFYNSTNNPIDSWLISPAVDLSGSTSPVFSFDNAYNYNGAGLQAFVSTNYDGVSAPSTATWVAAPATYSTGSFAWANSGDIDMSSFKVSNVYVAFQYTGSGSDGSTWEIDNIIIEE